MQYKYVLLDPPLSFYIQFLLTLLFLLFVATHWINILEFSSAVLIPTFKCYYLNLIENPGETILMEFGVTVKCELIHQAPKTLVGDYIPSLRDTILIIDK